MRELLDRSLGDNVHVEFDLPDALWPVEVDPNELELVVLNLAVNARDAMPHGGTISLRGENLPQLQEDDLAGDYVRLSVIDTGIGMPPEVRVRVFEPYFTTKDLAKGSGLGLAQVYGFAMQSGGAVRLASEVGRGTTIALYLPRSSKVPSADRDDIHQRVERQQLRAAGRVLLVEDDDEVAALTSEMLDQLGYEVTRASTAAAALGALADARRVDIVLSDIMMPGGMNGVELTREISQTSRRTASSPNQCLRGSRRRRSDGRRYPYSAQTLSDRRIVCRSCRGDGNSDANSLALSERPTSMLGPDWASNFSAQVEIAHTAGARIKASNGRVALWTRWSELLPSRLA